MDKRRSGLRTAISLLLVAMYAAGLVAMLASNVQLALILWVVSTLGGAGLLYWLRTSEKNKRAEEEAGADEPSGPSGGTEA